MDEGVDDEERAYWVREAQHRAADVDAAHARSDPPHLLAGALLRLKEAKERLAAMRPPPPDR